MVAVYSTFGEAEAARPAAGAKKYLATLGAAWVTLVVAAVLIVGNDNSGAIVMIQQGRPMMLAAKEFVPERNVFDEFDADFKEPAWKQAYDLQNEADFKNINIDSKDGVEGIDDPYKDQSPRLKVPEAVYTQPAPYDTSVVEIGEPVFGEKFHEYTAAEEGEAVMGKEYEDHQWKNTIESLPIKNPARDWDFSIDAPPK
mmetsp:Transcript_12185/g.29794  ORF Transcript_12185/g.29794 Transcript_12185/m.29794 type:complete len:199 (-) Transcript_12185:194-790(-)